MNKNLNPLNSSDIQLDEMLPLSKSQKGIWIGHNLSINKSIYNTAEYLEIDGNLNISAFLEAVENLVQNVDALNIKIISTDKKFGEILQIVSRNNNKHCQYLDFRKYSSPKKHSIDRMDSIVGKEINLEKGPIYKFELYHLEENKFIWFQNIHHIALDGYGYSLITKYVFNSYNILTKGGKLSDERLELAKVVNEDKAYQTSNNYSLDQAFWKSILKGINPNQGIKEFKNLHYLKPVKGFLSLPKRDFLSLKETTQINDCNWIDGILGLIFCWIYKYTGNSDLVIGMPIMARIGSKSIKIPAMSMNIIPIRIKINWNDTFESIVVKVANFLKKSKPHFRYRYEDLKKDLKLTGRNQRLFGIAVNIIPYKKQIKSDQLKINSVGHSSGPVEDLSISITLDSNKLPNLSFEGNGAIYSKKDIDKLLVNFANFKNSVFSQSEKILHPNIESLSFLDNDKIEPSDSFFLQNLNGLNNTQLQNIALESEEKTYSYLELIYYSQQFCSYILQNLEKDEKRVGIAMDRTEVAIFAVLACVMGDITFVPLDINGPTSRNLLILDRADIKYILTDSHEIQDITHADIKHIDLNNYLILLNSAFNSFDSKKKNDFIPKIKIPNYRNPAYMIFTSGSTGIPKGVPIGHLSLNSFIQGANKSYGFKKNSRVLQFCQMQFDAFIEEFFLTFATNSTLVLRNNEILESFEKFTTFVRNNRISVLDLPTAYWREMVKSLQLKNAILPPCLNQIIIGGEEAPLEYLKIWNQFNYENIDLINTYGPTESTVVASYYKVPKNSKPLNTIGKPIYGRSLAIVDENQTVVLRDRVGELVILETGLADGYLKDETLTSLKFKSILVPIQNSKPTHIKGYLTGDKAKITDDGNLIFLGRIDEEIKISGIRIQPLDIDLHLRKLDYIEDSKILPIEIGEGTIQLVGFLILSSIYDKRKESNITKKIKSHLKNHLLPQMIPNSFVILENFPTNSLGKIDKGKLESIYSNRVKSLNSHSTKTQIKEMTDFLNIWKGVLGNVPIKNTANFFDIGGDSLKTIQLANELSLKLKIKMEASDIFEFPTPLELFKKIEDSKLLDTQKTNIKSSNQELSKYIQEDSILPKSIKENLRTLQNDSSNLSINGNIILTGATGFLGIHILSELLKNTKSNIFCLIRAKNTADAMNRLKKNFIYHSLMIQNYYDRIVPICVDLEKENLGLSEVELENLSSNVDVIIHNGARVNVMQNYQSLRNTNVRSTSELLKIAGKNHSCRFLYISTISVVPSNENVLKSEIFYKYHPLLNDGYQQSKWASENLVNQANECGLDTCIIRLGRVSGPNNTGYINPTDLFWKIVKASIKLKQYPDLDIQEPWLPVDYIAESLTKIVSTNKLNNHSIIHGISSRDIRIQQLFKWINEYGYEIRKVKMTYWLNELKSLKTLEEQNLFNFFKTNQKKLSQISKPTDKNSIPMPQSDSSYSNSKYQNISNTNDLEIPEITKELFFKYLDYAKLKNLH